MANDEEIIESKKEQKISEKIEDLFFKGIPVWAVGIIAIVLLLFSMFAASGVLHVMEGGKKLGKVGKFMIDFATIPQTVKGMLSGNDLICSEQRFEGASGFFYNYASGERADYPYLLISRYDGDIQQSVAELFDLNTHEKIHTWVVNVDPIWDEINFNSQMTDLNRDSPTSRFRNKHTLLFDDGSILFKTEASPLLKFNETGTLVWINDKHTFHHSIELDHEGNIWVPSHVDPSTMGIVAVHKPFSHDAITKISPKGDILFRKSLNNILSENGLGHLIPTGTSTYFDPTHLNDIEPVLEDKEFWKKGDVFLSLRRQSMVLLYRPSSNQILWYSVGPWRHQHDVDVINSHEISVFDNNTIGNVVDGNNQFITYDFRTKKFSNPYNTGFEKLEIRTISEGACQLLPYGRIFVEETNYGRLVAFDNKGTVDWQFINRAKNGKVYLVNWCRLVPRKIGDAVRQIVTKK